MRWLRVVGEGATGPEEVKGAICCRLGQGASGEAWVDDIVLEQLAPY
jgi:hypothetical protein